MELSPRLLKDVEFGEQWRGYNQTEVDEFLERVAIALESLIQRFQETSARAEAAERRLLERGDEDEIRRTLLLAQRTAAAAVEEARAEAERIVAAADTSVNERLAAAEARLQDVENEVAERTRTELAALEARRAALAADVDALSAFVDEHRSRLARELHRELAWLERPELAMPEPPPLQAGPAGATSTPAGAPQRAHHDEPTPEQAAADAALGEDDDEEPAPAPAGSDDLAAAREELERALSGVHLDEPADEDDDRAPGRQIFDVLAEEDEPAPGEPTGVFDVLGDTDPEEHGDLEVQWREEVPEAPAPAPDPPRDEGGDEVDDDPFLTELRKAITDDDPLGPRDHEPGFVDDDDPEPAGSGWFRLRRPRG